MRILLLNIIIYTGFLVSCDLKTADEYFNDACQKEENGDFEGAIKNLNIVLKKKPNDIEALINRGIDYKALGKYDKAMIDLNKALSIDSTNIMALYNRGNLFFAQENFRNAINDYNKSIGLKGGEGFYIEIIDNDALGLRSSDVEMELIKLQRGLSYAELENYQKAYLDFSFCIEKKYKPDLAYLWRGVCNINLGFPDTGCQDWGYAKSLGMEEAQKYIEEYCIMAE